MSKYSCTFGSFRSHSVGIGCGSLRLLVPPLTSVVSFCITVSHGRHFQHFPEWWTTSPRWKSPPKVLLSSSSWSLPSIPSIPNRAPNTRETLCWIDPGSAARSPVFSYQREASPANFSPWTCWGQPVLHSKMIRYFKQKIDLEWLRLNSKSCIEVPGQFRRLALSKWHAE